MRWVKLTRTGNHFEGFTSTDGTSWGSPIATADVAMPSTLYVGIAGFREGDFTGTTGQMNVSNVSVASPLPSLWRTGDVGAIDVAGATAYAGGAYTIDAGGTWVWSTSDAFRFVYQPWSGDGTLVAHIESLAAGGGTDSAAGVMLRGDLTAGSPVATMLVFSSGKAKFRHRTSAGADINSTCCSAGPSTGASPPRWASSSARATTSTATSRPTAPAWGSPVGSADFALPTDVYAGVAVVREGNPGSARAHAVASSVSLH